MTLMRGIAACPEKSVEEMTREWDRLAEERHHQIASGEDLSFRHVVAPSALRLLEGANTSVVLDVGCGTGHFTVELASIAKRVIAIDPSGASIDVAKEVCREPQNVRFIEGYFENSVTQLVEMRPTCAVAVMTLMSVADLPSFVSGLANALPAGAKFVAIITHPWFWPKYWGYQSAPWFRYGRETFIEAPFTISRRRTKIITTHIHRPLEKYVTTFFNAGFRLELTLEPIPEPGIEALYPRPWLFPRFLGLRWERA
jgi:SAM-dependent methyltransferase